MGCSKTLASLHQITEGVVLATYDCGKGVREEGSGLTPVRTINVE